MITKAQVHYTHFRRQYLDKEQGSLDYKNSIFLIHHFG